MTPLILFSMIALVLNPYSNNSSLLLYNFSALHYSCSQLNSISYQDILSKKGSAYLIHLSILAAFSTVAFAGQEPN